jgi:acyl-CoA-binding protein
MAVHNKPMSQEQKEINEFLEKIMMHGKIKSYEVYKSNAVGDVPYFRLEIEGLFDSNL